MSVKVVRSAFTIMLGDVTCVPKCVCLGAGRQIWAVKLAEWLLVVIIRRTDDRENPISFPQPGFGEC